MFCQNKLLIDKKKPVLTTVCESNSLIDLLINRLNNNDVKNVCINNYHLLLLFKYTNFY